MACLNNLKLEIRTLESVFTKSHERFQVVAASVDELTCRFIGKHDKKYDIHANITVRLRFRLFHTFTTPSLLALTPRVLCRLVSLLTSTLFLAGDISVDTSGLVCRR